MLKRSFILVLFIIIIFSSTSFANEGVASGEVDYVIVQINEGVGVKLSSTEYIDIYIEKNNIYQALKGDNLSVSPVAIISGNKWISSTSYIDAYIENFGNLQTALYQAISMSPEFFKEIRTLDDPILINSAYLGSYQGNIENEDISFFISKTNEEDVISKIVINFSQKVKLDLPLQGEFNDEIKSKLKLNGYDYNNFYETYEIRSGWTYRLLAGLGKKLSITFINELGQEQKFIFKLIMN